MSFSDFTIVKLKDITIGGKGSYGIGAPAVDYKESLYTYLRITDITDEGTIIKEGLKSVDDNDASNYLLKKNDIVFARTGNSTGRAYFYDERDGEFVYAGFLIKFKLDENKVNPKYIKLYTLTNEYKSWVKSFATGSTRNNINAKMYGDMVIKLPRRNIQDKIVDIIESLNEKIRINNQMNETLEEIAEGLFKRWFVDFEFPNEEGKPYKSSGGEMVESELGMIPYNWKSGVLGDLIYVQNGYAFKGKDLMEHGEVGIIKIKNISSNTVDIINTQYISEILASKVDTKFKLCGTNLLIAMTGAEVGKIGLVPLNKKELYLNQRVGCIKELVPGGESYAYNYLLRPEAQEMIQAKAVGSAQPNISASGIEELKVVIPSNHILKAFQNICGSLLYNMCQLIEENYLLIELRDTLLPKLMSGEIRVSDLC
ncbi:restriction endonuclease subunit S [Turicibacter bilis]|uniref:restriction endonuclease subunit S n=1 Tax=Turicibacter bilis TaxID=2735723 RepID=UPI001BAFB058|nr:restriction endonuclease subunit S [Turicibacter bilis]MBS3203434.1 restriction endonuclease subunit S [Turicibacter bilis]UUF10752.1 restriction endonuclease subunit S [Turicibacter bilis]